MGSDERKPSVVPCRSCGGEVHEFTIPNEHWNALIRRGGKEYEFGPEYLCVQCFALVAFDTLQIYQESIRCVYESVRQTEDERLTSARGSAAHLSNVVADVNRALREHRRPGERTADAVKRLRDSAAAARAEAYEDAARLCDEQWAAWDANCNRPQSDHSGPSYAAAVAGAAATRDLAAAIRARATEVAKEGT